MSKVEMRLKARTIALVSLATISLIWLIWYYSGLKTLPAGYTLRKSDYENVLKQALLGDAEAADILGNFYMWNAYPNAGLGLLFRERAAILGNKNSQLQLKSYLDSYGLSTFREVVGRTNEIQEQIMLKSLEQYDPEEIQKE